MSVRRADHSSRGVLPTVVCRCVWSRKTNLVNEVVKAHWGLWRQEKKIIIFIIYYYYHHRHELCNNKEPGIASSTFRGLNPARDKRLFSSPTFPTGSGAHPAPFSVCSGVISRGLSDRAWSKLLIFVWWQGWESVELYLCSPHMPS